MADITDGIFNEIPWYESYSIPIQISPSFVSNGPTNNAQALFQIMTWHWTAKNYHYGNC